MWIFVKLGISLSNLIASTLSSLEGLFYHARKPKLNLTAVMEHDFQQHVEAYSPKQNKLVRKHL